MHWYFEYKYLCINVNFQAALEAINIALLNWIAVHTAHCTYSTLYLQHTIHTAHWTDLINQLTPIFSISARGQFVSEIKQKQSECDSYRNINSVCDSVGDSLLPTSSAHSIIHFSNRPGANNCRGDSHALLKQWGGPGVCEEQWGRNTEGGGQRLV